MKALPFTLALLAVPMAASAHISFVATDVQPGARAVEALRVSHGCDGSATTALRVEIPESVTVAKPQAKPGWTITVEHTALKTPIKGEGGKTVTDRVSAITWTGQLPDDEFDDFAVMLALPKDAKPVYFPAMQTCEKGSAAWTDIPAAGQAKSAHPAPVIDLAPHGMGGMDMAMPGMDHSH
ncbi:MAG TPA: YcnI family protein [Asticcacaulis sp.]|nr:YcnI family protein [Asticcacaulis sp.]